MELTVSTNTSVSVLEVSYRHSEAHDILSVCIDSLPSKQRTTILLHYMDEMQEKDIADLVGVSERHVQRLHAAALSRLREMLRRGNICSVAQVL